MEFVYRKASGANLIPPQYGPEELQRYLDVCKAHHHLEFHPGQFDGHLTLIRARENSERVSTDPLLGWGDLAAAGVDLHWVSGSHETMLDGIHARELAELLTEKLTSHQTPKRQSASTLNTAHEHTNSN